MEVFLSLGDVILYDSKANQSLWCNRSNGNFLVSTGERIQEEWNPVLLGTVHGIIGKMQILPGSEWRLLVISGSKFVGYSPGGVEIYCITKITLIPLTSDNIDLGILELEQPTVEQNGDKSGSQKVQQTWNYFKNSASNIGNKSNTGLKEKEKMEKRFTEELLKMFNDSGSFYYSPNGDITNSQQRLHEIGKQYHWKQTDDRFFWNKFMLKELIESEDPSASSWILPIIQGFVQIERCFIDHLENLNVLNDNTDGINDSEDEEDEWDEVDFSSTKYKTAENMKEEEFDLIVISRRSRHRAGTRYKRRGVNDKGHVANYVETEQIVCVLKHIVSAVLVRGSVPVYWSQPGTKYRPLPIIDKEFEESRKAFANHFEQEFDAYKKEVIVSLVELNGREKIIADSFLQHIFDFSSENLVFVTFDFHEYCRGMKFENVSILINALDEYIRKSGFYWIDNDGMISIQESVFRINCMDCLDRTNVVQASIARNILLNVLRKLGRLLPDEELPYKCQRMFNIVWANNGDAISRQYAGTAAMKGDFTRTGERKIAGVMKDGYNSANRYYLNRFKDNYRQTVIDMMLGNSLAEDLSAIASAGKSVIEEEVWTSDKEECITQLVRHSELTLLPPDEECLGGWALVDPFSFVLPNDPPQDEDVILLLTHEAYYVASYNDELEELSSYQRIPLENLIKIEIGMEAAHFKNQYIFMRLFYGNDLFHTMRTIQNRSLDESKGILLSIAELFLSICQYQTLPLKIAETRLDKKRPRSAVNVIPLTSKRTLSTSSRHKHVQQQKIVRRRSRSLSSLESPTQEKELQIPDIKLNDADSEFSQYHRKFSPSYTTEKMEFQEVSANDATLELKLSHSKSDNSISSKQSSIVKPFFKMDAFLRKTKNALGTVGPKLRDFSFSKDDSNEGQNEVFQQPASEAVKTKLKRINDKFAIRAAEVKSKVLPEFRNRIQSALTSSPKPQKKRYLSEAEKEKRMLCKTKILEL